MAIPKNELIPTTCPSCNSALDVKGIHLVCTNKECPEILVLKIIHYCETAGMEFFSDSSIRSLFDSGKIKNVVDLYHLTESDFENLEGFGKRKIDNAIGEIERTKEMGVDELCDRLGIELVGRKAINKLGIKSVEDLWNFNDETYVIGQNLISYLKFNKKMVENLLKVVKIKKPVEVKVSAGAKHIATTGAGPKKRDDLVNDILAKGDVWDEHVNKGTNILLVEDVNSGSSKIVKAQKMGVSIMNYKEYFS